MKKVIFSIYLAGLVSVLPISEGFAMAPQGTISVTAVNKYSVPPANVQGITAVYSASGCNLGWASLPNVCSAQVVSLNQPLKWSPSQFVIGAQGLRISFYATIAGVGVKKLCKKTVPNTAVANYTFTINSHGQCKFTVS